MPAPRISIIVATRNAERVLPRLLESLAGQSFREFEVVVQDGASTDQTHAVAEAFAPRLPALHWHSEPDSGISDAWNKAVVRASGEWLLFAGADDFCADSHALAGAALRLAALAENVELCAFPVHSTWPDGTPLEVLSPSRQPWQDLAQGMCLPHQGLFHRRRLFQPRHFDPQWRIAGDYAFACAVVRRGNISFGYTPVLHMPVGGASARMEAMVDREREFLRIAKQYFPASRHSKIRLRLLRGGIYRLLARLCGSGAAEAFADLPRRLRGAPPLWTRLARLQSLQPQSKPLPACPKCSLIVATLGRVKPLRRLLESLRCQTWRHFEIILVDQNPSGFLDALLRDFTDVPIIHLMQEKRGVSLARNAGLQRATGDVIAFPDDDCCYASDTLEKTVYVLRNYPRYGGILGVWEDISRCGQPAPLSIVTPTPLDRYATFRRGETYVHFFHADSIKAVYFDPALGPGDPPNIGCGEDTDFLLQILSNGWQVGRTKAVRVFHPEVHFTPSMIRKIREYGVGRMNLLRKHQFPMWFQLANVAYPLCRMPLEFFKGGSAALRYRWQMFFGRLHGLFRL